MNHPTVKQWASWYKMTANNAHTEVRVEIAKWLQTNTSVIVDDALEVLEHIERHNRESPFLSQLESFARIGATDVILGRVHEKDEDLEAILRSAL